MFNDATTGAGGHAPGVAPTQVPVVLVEDHAILREGLKALIEFEAELKVVGEAGCAQDGVELAERLQPQVVVTDLALPGRSGIALITELQEKCPETRILVLTAHNTEEYIRAALNAGATGYVLKDSSRAELIQAIRSVATGRQFLCQEVSARILSRYLMPQEAPKPTASSATVTGREREVLTSIALGHSNKHIARLLNLSVKTVEKHRSNLMRKLGLHNTAAVTMFAIRNGYVRSEEVAGVNTAVHT